MKSADNLKRLFKDAELSINPDTDERVFEDVLQAQQDTQKNLPAMPESIWRITMKSPITKLATAAIVAIACLIGLSLWRGTESGIALADVLARVEKVKAVRYKTGFKITGGDPNKPYNVEIRSTSLTSQEYGSKTTSEQNDPNGGVSKFEFYTLPQKKTRINIGHKNKTYRRFELDDVQIERIQKELDIRDWVAFLKKIVGSKYKTLGRATIDGNEVEVFQTTDPNCTRAYFKNPQVDVKIWVDVKTKLIVRYEESITEQVGDRYLRHQLVMYDFQWDVPVDPAEFEPVIPDGYTGTVVNWAAITEPNAIQRLKQCVELFGNYPESIDRGGLFSALKKSKTPAALRLKEEIKGLTDEEKAKRIIWDPALPIQCLDRFRFALIADGKDPAYYGKTVTPKDVDKVLMRWKVSDNEYRVIYGDLHAETVTPEKLAELEKALPK